MILVEKKLTKGELKKIAQNTFGEMVKAVVDIRCNLLALDAELYSDLEGFLLEKGSKQKDLWGINLYPDMNAGEMINIRTSQGNRTRGIDNKDIQKEVMSIVYNWVEQ